MILFVDACVRTNSRTRELAETLLQRLGPYESLSLPKEMLPALDAEMIAKRDADSQQGNFEDSCYDYAKQFAAADQIVIAAPFWDLSFPAILKQYLELICVPGITFHYSEEGFPVGMCRAKKLYYVTTAGGEIFNRDFGYGYVKMLAEGMFGVKECHFFSAENLDVDETQTESILNQAKEEIRAFELTDSL